MENTFFFKDGEYYSTCTSLMTSLIFLPICIELDVLSNVGTHIDTSIREKKCN